MRKSFLCGVCIWILNYQTHAQWKFGMNQAAGINFSSHGWVLMHLHGNIRYRQFELTGGVNTNYISKSPYRIVSPEIRIQYHVPSNRKISFYNGFGAIKRDWAHDLGTAAQNYNTPFYPDHPLVERVRNRMLILYLGTRIRATQWLNFNFEMGHGFYAAIYQTTAVGYAYGFAPRREMGLTLDLRFGVSYNLFSIKEK
jgi:hypothetical protein